MESPAGPIPPASTESEELHVLLSELSSRWCGEKPLGRLFQTETHSYYYDSATNKIFQCDSAEAEFLSLLLNKGPDRALSECLVRVAPSALLAVLSRVKAAMESENILSVTRAPGFGLSDHHRDYRSAIETSCGILGLDTTEACNLRCRYCIYNPGVDASRNHGSRHMSWEVARKAVDYLEEHSSALREVSITFYGGEPLLNFRTIARAVEYALGKTRRRHLDFNISTNGVLITPQVADFLKSNDFKVALSMDGPQHTHDMYRVDRQGNGSYNQARRGLKLLIAAYGEEAARRKIKLNIVYTPPFNRERLNALRSWKEEDRDLKNLHVHVAYPARGSLPQDCYLEAIVKEDQSVQSWSQEDFRSSWSHGEETSSIAAGFMAEKYELINSRPVYSQPPFLFHLNGCCLPGVRRLFVSVDGRFHVCEKIAHDAPTIGSVSDGIDIEAIKRVYIDDYERMSLPKCSTCWAIRLCTLCYVQAVDRGRFDADAKAVHCANQRRSAASLLKSYCSLLEIKPDGFRNSHVNLR